MNTVASSSMPRMHWGLLLAASATLMITMGARQTTGLFVAPIHQETGIGIAAISFALAIGQFTWGAVQPVFGAVADKRGSTGVLILAVTVLTSVQWIRHRKVSSVSLISAVLVLVFGGLTIVLHDKTFIQWKVTVLDWLLAAGLFASHFFGEQPFTQRLLGQQFVADRATWLDWDASALMARAKFGTSILIDQGEADKFLAEQLYPDVFAEACAAAGQKLTLRRHPGYDHGYYFIQSFVAEHLSHHAALLG